MAKGRSEVRVGHAMGGREKQERAAQMGRTIGESQEQAREQRRVGCVVGEKS